MKKLHKLRGLFSQDPQNEIHKLDEQIMFFDDVWGSDRVDLAGLAEERGIAMPKAIHPGANEEGDAASILYYPGAAGKPDVAVDLSARHPDRLFPAVIELENGNRLFGLRGEGVALSTVYHDSGTYLGCGPSACWAQFRGAVPIGQIEIDLANLQRHRTGENIHPGSVSPADLLSHYLRYQGMKVSEEPHLEMVKVVGDSMHHQFQDSIFSGRLDATQKHTFATVYDWPVEQSRDIGNMLAIPGDDLYFWAYETRPRPTHTYYRPWKAELDNIEVELREDWL